MKRIHILLPRQVLGGAEYQAGILAERLSSCGAVRVEVDACAGPVLKREYPVDSFNRDVVLLNVKNRYYRRIFRYVALMQVFLKLVWKRPDLVVFYSPLFISLIPFFRLVGVKVAFSIRENSDGLFGLYHRLAYRMVNYLSTNTPSVQRRLKVTGIYADLILNEVYIPAPMPPDRERSEFLLVVANVEPHKRIDLAIRTAARLNRTLKICGRTDNSQYLGVCRNLAKNLNVEVEFLGGIPKDSVRKEMSECACMLHPSVLEGTSNAVLDAVACGVPIVVSDTPENSMLVNAEVDFLFDPDDLDSLVSSVSHVLAVQGQWKYIEKQNELRGRVVKLFDGEDVKKYAQLLVAGA